jgi:hypothetical protein
MLWRFEVSQLSGRHRRQKFDDFIGGDILSVEGILANDPVNF